MKRISLLVMTVGVLANLVYAQPEAAKAQEKKLAGKPAEFIDNTFYIYKDYRDLQNHYAPCVPEWDTEGVKFRPADVISPHSGKTCTRVTLLNKMNQKDRWGVGWGSFSNASDWGFDGTYSFTGAKTLKFWVRGEKGGEKVEEFRVGWREGSSDTAVIGPVTLSKEWQEFEIDLKGKDLSYIPVALGVVAEKKDNPNGMTFYLDDIRFEK